MVVHDHYADCEVVKPLLDQDLPDGLPNSFLVDDSKLLFSFEFDQEDVHEKDGEILDVLSVHDVYVYQIGIKNLVSNNILKELLPEDDSIVNLKLLIDPDKLQCCLKVLLVGIGRRGFIDTNHLFLNNSVQRLKKHICSQTYNLFKTDGVMNMFVRLHVANKHNYGDIQEYHRSHAEAVLRYMRLRPHNYRFSGYEDEVFQLVQSASMGMEQPKKLIGASGASINALETTKYRSEECKQVTCCSVCYQDFITEEEIKKMPCSSAHIFHTDCIEK